MTVLYFNPRATPEVCDIIRSQMPPRWRLTKPEPEASDLRPWLSECDFILVPDCAVTAEHVAAAPKLLMIQHQGVGYEKIDLEACRDRGIPVALTPEGTSVGVAEHTILLILALYKQIVTAANGVRAGHWMQWELRSSSFELSGKTLGLAGFGRIGREVARRAAAFDARILFFDPVVKDPAVASGSYGRSPATLPARRCSSFEELLTESDIVSLHVPLTAETQHLINERALGLMKPNAVMVNTARGGLVDERALIRALDLRQIAGAALDVLEKEPPDPANPLLGMPNVLITPHISAGTCDALITKMRAAFANMERFTRGEPLKHVVPELASLQSPTDGH